MAPPLSKGISTYVATSVSRSTSPRDDSSKTSAATKVFVMLATAMAELGTSGVPDPSTPDAPAHVPAGVTTAAVAPGDSSFAQVSLQRRLQGVALGRGHHMPR